MEQMLTRSDDTWPRRAGERTSALAVLFWVFVITCALALAAYATLATYYLRTLRTSETIVGLRAARQPIGGVSEIDLPARLFTLEQAHEGFLQ